MTVTLFQEVLAQVSISMQLVQLVHYKQGYTRLLPKENFREKIKVGSPSHNFGSPELISDLSINQLLIN